MHNAIFNQLIVFQTIAAEGSISAAAVKLGVTTPSASKSLKQLEATIGLPLFTRTTRRIELTEAGHRLLADTSAPFQAIEHAVNSARELSDVPQGSVRITVSRVAYYAFIQPHYAEFCQQFPQIELEISINDGTMNIIESGFDMGIRFGNIVDDNMVARKLLPSTPLGLYASPRYLAEYGQPQTPEDLVRHKLIGFRFTTSQRLSPLELLQNGTTLTIEMPHALIANDMDIVAHAIEQGLGIGRLFPDLVPQYYPLATLVPILPQYWQHYPASYLYYPKNSAKAARVRALVDFLLAKNQAS